MVLVDPFPVRLLRGGNSLLKYAIICLVDILTKAIKNSQETPQIRAFHGILRRLKSMIKVLFVCHGTKERVRIVCNEGVV